MLARCLSSPHLVATVPVTCNIQFTGDRICGTLRLINLFRVFAMANPVNVRQAVPQSTSRSSMQSQASGQPLSNSNKSADYVFFERTTTGFSGEAVPRAKTAQLKLEHYYKVAVDAAIERNTRCFMLLLSR